MITLFIILIILSAFFSSLETALFHIKPYEQTNNTVRRLLKNPKKLLVSLLTGNTLVNIGLGSLGASYTLYLYNNNANFSDLSISFLLFVEVIIVTIILLIFGEVIPKTYAMKKSEKLANISAKTLQIYMKIISPITFIFYIITKFIVYILPIKKEQIFDSEEELIMLAEIGEEEGALDQEESDMIQSVFEFKNKLVKEILTPRVDVVSLDSSQTLDNAMDIIMTEKFSKIPVYKNSIDNIKGILYAKDIIPYLIGSRPKIELIKLSREPYFIPETKPIDDLLKEFKVKKTSIAVVVDEWGGTSGIVTLEDVVEEVMGELSDPYDREEYEIIRKKDGNIITDGAIKIYDLEENMDLEFPDNREYDTLAGYILDAFGDIPEKGTEVSFQNYNFKVIKLNSNRIDKVEISKLNKLDNFAKEIK